MTFNPDTIKNFPGEPGVYIMRDKKGKVLYVGKAINLRNRVRQYFLPGGDGRAQVPYLVKKIARIDTMVVSSEKEALLLENTLIKQYQPPYNVFLKDDKGYISLKITTKHEWPMIELVRYKGKPKPDGLYCGPYTSTYAARQTLELLIRLFPLRRCSDDELKRRTRPCILHGMKRCVAPCVGKCTKPDYDAIVEKTVRFLQGKDRDVLNTLYDEMKTASESLEFERASDLHQTIRHIEHTVEQQRVDQAGTGNRDVIGLYREAGELSLTQMLFRDGKLIGAENYHFSSLAQETPAALSTFLIQTYKDKELPQEIIIPAPPDPTLSEIIPTRLHHPKRGDKLKLIEMATANAKAAFHKERDLTRLREKTLIDLQERLRLRNYPRRIECFDNSNLQGSEPVAAMIAFTDGESDKKRYRKYKVKTVSGSDDYATMHEILSRRYTRAKKEDDLPDLIIVDGGKGQLNIALKVLQDLNIVTVDIIGLAKESGRHDRGATREQIFLPGTRDPLLLRPNHPVLFLLQRIRDEAHRFAITFHRKQREKTLLKSPLDNVPGIGPTKRKALLRHFGSAKKALAATAEELAQVKELTKRDIATLLELQD